ncbi:MAG: hypothetical protein NT047_05550 [Deltaproteobacteria bacterium]|nr:hypothetical protein [Deltaproteobacteria bacterium]
MPAEDIAKLKIEKSEKIIKPGRRRKKPFVIAAVVLLILTAGGLYFGGMLPALRASRMKIVDALRAT